MKLSDLSPFPVFINWEGSPVEIKPFSLRAMAWAGRFFFRGETDGFERMNSILRNEEGQEVFFNTLIDIVYYLGYENFDKIGVDSPIVIKKKVFGETVKLNILEDFKKAVEEIIIISFPENKSKRREFDAGNRSGELKNKKVKTWENENWEQIYIEFYRSGGMSIDQFMNLTMRQINPLLEEISFKRSEELNIISDLIHKKIEIKKQNRKPPEMDFSNEDVKTFENMYQKFVEESRIN